MKLVGSYTSPFVRKLSILLLEKGITFEFINELPYNADNGVAQFNPNQQRVVQFANHAVEELDKVLLPLQAGSEVLLPLIGLPCSVAHLPLRKQAAKLQTVRSIGLVPR